MLIFLLVLLGDGLEPAEVVAVAAVGLRRGSSSLVLGLTPAH